MEFKIECPWCHQHYSADESFVGQTIECSVCGKEFTVRHPNNLVVAKPDTTDYFSEQEITDDQNISQDFNPKRKTFLPKSIIRKGILVIAVFVLIALCVVYYMKVIPEKEYKKGLNAYSEQNYEAAVEFFQKAADHGHKMQKASIRKCFLK